ncbi:nitrogen fixation protein NifZ [Tepidiphilus baoligensis]|uniref:Nitrogen fixation protein NifZ n=1 Tax=Tepidiphilus baoligensis TaxID=2698687 RepID=A0ABX1QJT1_9PROT|nr:nitrogen fixation protein NifZ [Tepidiphilus baoligensis]NMH16223.1 nitrogen fixation protein NifZ [Tepidiphilus baoligensis]
MSQIRRNEEIELLQAPVFTYGQKVRARKNVRNDGTFPGAEIGEILVCKGDVGYVQGIGTFLQQFYIYAVDFVDRARLVGMRAKELEAVEAAGGGQPKECA